MQPPPSADEEAIRLDRLSFTYAGGDRPALDDVSLRVRRGEMVVVMGATGAGKTTLAKCLNRTVPAFQPGEMRGSVSILGRRLETEGVADLAGVVGLVSQDFEAQLFATNVAQETVFALEQLGVGRDEMRRRVKHVLDLVGLDGFEKRDPSTLSGGEKQRLAIAATLAMQPQILVFDEPTTDLDPLGKIEIFDVLRTMRRHGYTLVVIEHESAAAERADRVVVLNAGRIVADDTPARVLARIDFLVEHGVRPPDLSRVAAGMRLAEIPPSVDAAVAVIETLDLPRPPSSATVSPASTEAPAAPLLAVDDVWFDYESGRPALRGVSLQIAAGEFVAVIGQNGSGKTTLAKHLNGLLRPKRGRVRLDGKDLLAMPLNQVADDVGYVFQNPDHQIFAATVYDEAAFGPRNLRLAAGDVEERVRQALDAVALTGIEDEDPFLLGKGQRQRLAVASLLALRPRALILDEPTTGLDFAEQQRMMGLVARLHRDGMAIVMITHSPWVVAEYARRGILMREGRVVFDGPLRDLFAETELLESAHFRPPDVTLLGRRFGFTPLAVDEFLERMGAAARA